MASYDDPRIADAQRKALQSRQRMIDSGDFKPLPEKLAAVLASDPGQDCDALFDSAIALYDMADEMYELKDEGMGDLAVMLANSVHERALLCLLRNPS